MYWINPKGWIDRCVAVSVCRSVGGWVGGKVRKISLDAVFRKSENAFRLRVGGEGYC